MHDMHEQQSTKQKNVNKKNAKKMNIFDAF